RRPLIRVAVWVDLLPGIFGTPQVGAASLGQERRHLVIVVPSRALVHGRAIGERQPAERDRKRCGYHQDPQRESLMSHDILLPSGSLASGEPRSRRRASPSAPRRLRDPPLNGRVAPARISPCCVVRTTPNVTVRIGSAPLSARRSEIKRYRPSRAIRRRFEGRPGRAGRSAAATLGTPTTKTGNPPSVAASRFPPLADQVKFGTAASSLGGSARS